MQYLYLHSTMLSIKSYNPQNNQIPKRIYIPLCYLLNYLLSYRPVSKFYIYIPLCYLLNMLLPLMSISILHLHSTMLSIKLCPLSMWREPRQIYIPLCYLLNNTGGIEEDDSSRFTFHYVIY